MLPGDEQRARPAGNHRSGSENIAADDKLILPAVQVSNRARHRGRQSVVGVTGIDMEHIGERVLQEAFRDALAITWNRRADEFDASVPRPGDYHGQATAEEIAQQDARLTSVAQACRARAELALVPDDAIDDLILDVLGEVA